MFQADFLVFKLLQNLRVSRVPIKDAFAGVQNIPVEKTMRSKCERVGEKGYENIVRMLTSETL